jgi:hypothetical protein
MEKEVTAAQSYLDCWAPIGSGFDEVAPEQILRLKGKVYNRPLYQDGSMIHTPTIVAIDSQSCVVMSSGARYELGYIDPAYAAKHKDAVERIQKIIRQKFANVE